MLWIVLRISNWWNMHLSYPACIYIVFQSHHCCHIWDIYVSSHSPPHAKSISFSECRFSFGYGSYSPARNTAGKNMIWNISCYHTSRADDCIVTDCNTWTDDSSCCNPYIIANCFDGDSSSPAWNVAGRKMARCQQRWQSLAESLDGAETLPADIKERCRKCLFQAAFQHLLLCSQGDWTTAYKARAEMWTKSSFLTPWPFFIQFERKVNYHL